jgi:RNA polymerase sigma-70 factor, ECF subfamily
MKGPIQSLEDALRDGTRSAASELPSIFLYEVINRGTNYMRANGLNLEDAEDLAQEAAFRVARGIHMWLGGAKLLTWINTIFHNTLVEFWRSRQMNERRITETISEDGDGDAPHELVHASDGESVAKGVDLERLLACMHVAFEEFRADYPEAAELIHMFHFDELSQKEIAEAFGTTEHAIRQRLYEARKKFKLYAEPCLKILSEE